MATKKHAGVNEATQVETNNEIRCIFDARLALETERAKINSMVGALGILADGDDAPLFYTLLNAIEPVDAELERIIEAMATLEPRSAPASAGSKVANPDFYRRTYEEWSAALIVATEGGDRRSDELHAKADKLAETLTDNSATTAGDAALKLRAISHRLFVANVKAECPQEIAALASLLADLERIDAGENFSRRAGDGRARP